MIAEVCRVMGCLALGEVLSRLSPITLPGSVLGLLLLFAWLCAMSEVPPALGSLADAMLGLFGLFFVPAGVGVMLYRTIVGKDMTPILLAVLLGTLVTVGASGAAATLLVRWQAGRARR